MTINPQGTLNLTSLIVPDLIVQIIPPDISQLNGVASNIVGIVGTATWGPVNSPTPFSAMSDYAAAFGPIQARRYDMGTAAAAAILNGAANFRGVRVTDGTDVAASAPLNSTGQIGTAAIVSGGTGYAANDVLTVSGGTQTQTAQITVNTVNGSGVITSATVTRAGTYTVLPTNPASVTDGAGTGATFNLAVAPNITFAAKYTGTTGNGITVMTGPGSAAGSFKVTVLLAGFVPEVFDNITGSGPAVIWAAITAAINNGQSGLRGPSQLIVATDGLGHSAVPTVSTPLTGGTDGATTITSSVLIGVDTTPRTGMYALRSTGASVAMLADCADSTTWATQVAFGLAEGIYMIDTTPAGDTIANAITAKTGAGIDSYAMKILLGDWCYFNDTVNGQVRLISPQGFIAGYLGNASPQNSSLNKPLYGIVGTQKSYSNQVYSGAELQLLGSAGIDVITNPVPGGAYFGARFGRNTSSNPVIHGDNYTRLTNYIAATLNAGMGKFVGLLQSADERRTAGQVLSQFLDGMAATGMIGNADGSTPYSVQIDSGNNPTNLVALGVQIASVKVQYLAVIEFFVINLQGGQSVTISRLSTQPTA